MEGISNPVPVRKKSGEIMMLVEFWYINRESEKDNYPIPSMEQILQIVQVQKWFLYLIYFHDTIRF